MNAAETTRSENQRRRLTPAAKTGMRSGQRVADASQPLAVLLRLPNLDAPRPASRESTTASIPETKVIKNTTAEARPSPNANVPTAKPAANSASNIAGWLWRMTILAAAIGLVLLAYRIINGPSGETTPLEEAPLNMNVVTDTPELTAPPVLKAEVKLPPTNELAAPSTLAPPNLEMEAAPLETAPTTVTPAPYRATDSNLAEGASESDADAGERRPWATGVRMEQPRGDGSIRTARSDWDNGWDRGTPNNPPTVQDAPIDPPADSWDSTEQPAPSFDYPETSPNTWRDEGRWESTPRGAAPQNQRAASPDWNQPTHSAMRPRESSGVRLQGNIEQPPLRRDDERNRPGIY